MYRTIEAEIHPDGSITLCEPIKTQTRCRAMVTILQPVDEAVESDDQGHWLDDLWDHRIPIDGPFTPLSRDEAHQR